MAGGIGLMTLAVMTRATLGHTGRALTANIGTTALYLIATVAVFARLKATAVPELSGSLHLASGPAWIAAFGGFALLYGPLLIAPRSNA